MSVTIRTGPYEATISNYEWRCQDKSFRGALNTDLGMWGPSGDDPNPDLNAAEHAVERFGGRIVEVNQSIKFDPKKVY